MTTKPPVMRGTVPPNYRGPLYYRLHVFQWHAAKKPLQQMITFDDRAMGQRLANVSHPRAAWRQAPEICDANGDLLADLRTPVKARLKAGARKWDEYSVGSIILVSPRIRDIIEEMAPGAHYFVPVDVADHAGGSFRVYAFYCGLAPRRTALALKANGIPYTTSQTGELVFTPPVWAATSDQFGYLEASVVGGAPLLSDDWLNALFSQELMERLGDVLPKGWAFVPMGLVDEP